MEKIVDLIELTKPQSQGPYPSFKVYHLSKAIELIGEEKSMGRSTLSNRLNIGIGVARTLITHLQKAGLITTSKIGCELSVQGYKLYKKLKSRFPKKSIISCSEYSLGKCHFGILVKNAAPRMNKGIEQRDAAVIAGGKGAVTLIFRNGRLHLPHVDDSRDLEIPKNISNIFNPEENDVIVICGSNTEVEAEAGATAAAWTLIS